MRQRFSRVSATSIALITLLLCSASIQAQNFEVASIHPSGPKSIRGSDGGPGSRDPARYVFNRASLLDLILTAYHFEDFQISSKLPLDRDEFDLAARVPAGATRDEFRAMLRNFLVDRFHLRAHLETRNFDAFALIVAKGGPKLGSTPPANAPPDDRFPALKPGRPGMAALNSLAGSYEVTGIRAQGQSITAFAGLLRRHASRPVVDQTGLQATYDFIFEFSRLLDGAATDVGTPAPPDLPTALKQQLGLQLVAKKLPFRVVVVDAVDRLPRTTDPSCKSELPIAHEIIHNGLASHARILMNEIACADSCYCEGEVACRTCHGTRFG